MKKRILIFIGLLIASFQAKAQDTMYIHKAGGEIVKFAVEIVDSITFELHEGIDCPGGVSDIDGNEYDVVRIGNQCWMADNMRTTRYADGTAIPNVEGEDDWDELGTTEKGYCWYENNPQYAGTYGALYNWQAASGGISGNENPSGIQGVCPDGWHLPGNAEWQEMFAFMVEEGYQGVKGDALKSNSGWDNNGNGSDVYGFNAKPAAYRYDFGQFNEMGETTYFWTTTELDDGSYAKKLMDSGPTVYEPIPDKGYGFSVRCVKD